MVPVAPNPGAPLLERESELQALTRAFAAVESGGSSLCTVVEGGAGMGKTSLVQAFLGTLPAAAQVLQCSCDRTGGAPVMRGVRGARGTTPP